MKITSFLATKVHGYLNFNVDFYDDISFLIGINGSGKTSVLKLVLGLTSPSYDYLNQVDYQYCRVVCTDDSHKNESLIIIESIQEEDVIHIKLTIDGKEKNSTPIKRIRNKESLLPDRSNSAIERVKKEEFDILDITKAIRAITTPKFLGLDRRIYDGRSIDLNDYSLYYKQRKYHNDYYRKSGDDIPQPQTIDISLMDVQSLVYMYYRKIAVMQPKISEEFKQKIFQQSFRFVDDYNPGSIPDTIEGITQKRQKVSTALEELGIGYLNYSMNNFFKKMEEVIVKNKETREKQEGSILTDNEHLRIVMSWFGNSMKLANIDEIINYSQSYQEKVADLREPAKRLETIVSNFLKEGNKRLKVNNDGEIKVVLKNGKETSIFELSSGEKQIIIMIAHLIFEEDQQPSGIFIIDEPELSLHVAWQEIFVDSIIEASPKTQFILATHSPSIVAKIKREKFCIDLSKSNM